MKMSLLLFVISVFVSSCGDTGTSTDSTEHEKIYTRTSDIEKKNFTGSIQSVEEANYTIVDSSGVIIAGKKNKLPIHSKMFFDEEGFLERVHYFNDKDELMEEVIIRFDSLTGISSWLSIQDAKDTIVIKRVSIDESGRDIRSESYTTDGKLDKYHTTKYDSREIVMNSFNNDGTGIGKSNALLDSLGRIKDFEYFENGIRKKVLRNEFNEHNDIVKTTIERKGMENINMTYVYKYDTQENWIKRIEYEEGVPISITQRNITYY